MPYIVQGDSADVRSANYRDMKFDYEYPYELDLDPNSDFHEELRSKIWQRAIDSRRVMSKRYDSWNEIDKINTAYIPLSDKEENVKNKDSRKPVSIIFPYSYSNLESLLTYMSLAFFQDPMFKYEGVEDDDTIGAMLMELIIRLHCIKTKVPLTLHTILRDNFSYGVGVGIPEWVKRYGKVPVKSTINTFDELGEEGTETVVNYIDGLVFEGNSLNNIDPYLWLPDPSVSSDKLQDGEFCGWIDRDNYMNLLSEEGNGDDYFNVKYLKGKTDKRSALAADNSERETKFGGSSKTVRQGITSTTSPVDVISMYVTLVPSEWKLGGNEYPEKWFFRLGADDVIITAKKANHYHGMYPMAVASSEYDGYSITPIGRLEVLKGLQGVLDWMFNCYDDKTEVLTSAGWLKIKDARKINADVATVDTETGSMWFEKPKQWFEYDYDGDLKLFESKRYSLAVTPNHNMFGRYRHDSTRVFKEARLINERSEWDEFKIPTAVYFSGPQPSNLEFDAVLPVRDRGSKLRYPKVSVNIYTLAGFLGWLLSDGGITKGKSSGTYSINIKQSKEQYFKEIDYFTFGLPFNVTNYYDKKQCSWQWTIADKRFFNWIKDNCYHKGTTGEFKEVPDIIRHADRFTLERFFNAFVHGDGHVIDGHDNLIQIGTESKQLADDLQEIAIKLGYSCNISDTATSSGKPFWMLNINKDAPWATITSKNTTNMRYKGKVYCFENSTHLTLIRRNGKAVLCGQSHIANVRKAINDMLVVDPFLVNIKDLEDPQPGKLIRLRRPAWGHGVKDAVQQLQVNDITRANIADSAYITQWMDRISKTDGSMSGMLRQGGPERLTKGEFQGTRGSAISQLQRVAMIIGMQFMQDIGTMFAVHTQQYMTKETYVRITGRYEEQLKSQFGQDATRAHVSPLDIAVNYDLIVRDGSIPGGNFSDSWIQLFNIIASQPELYQSFDLTRIFMYIAQQLGAKNVEDFKRDVNRIQPKNMDDEEALRQREKGNIIPAEDF